MEHITTDICIIGAGSGGLSLAAGAAQMGARVVLIEGSEMGGDCLNAGCIPSKAMIHASSEFAAMAAAAQAPRFGISLADPPQIDFDDLYQRAEEIHATLGLADGEEWVDGLYAWMDQD